MGGSLKGHRRRRTQPPDRHRDHVDLLDPHGNKVQQGGEDVQIEGARTIVLDTDEADLAKISDLWIQGGTPTLPITDPNNYSYAALRCAKDILHGDNVEFISYPTGYSHVFCFAYYVMPAVTSGTIVVRKELRDVPPGTATQPFQFVGDISYNPGGNFEIRAPGEISFNRAGGRTWSFAENVPSGMQLIGPTCTVTPPATNPPTPARSTWEVNESRHGGGHRHARGA